MKIYCRYESVLYSLYSKEKQNISDLRSLLTAFRGKIDLDSDTRNRLILDISICLFPQLRMCYSYSLFKSNSVIGRRVRYRLKNIDADIRRVDINDKAATAFISMIETIDKFLEGNNPQALHTFIINNLPDIYCRNIKEYVNRYSANISTEFSEIPELKEPIDYITNEYREKYLLGMSKTKFYQKAKSIVRYH